MEMYPECFNGTVGCFDDYTYHITLDPEVSPVVHATTQSTHRVEKRNYKLNYVRWKVKTTLRK